VNNRQKKQLNEIITDNISGSSELVQKINLLFINDLNDIRLIKESLPLLKNKLSHFTAVKKYLDQIIKIVSKGDSNKLNDYLNSFEDTETIKYLEIAKKFRRTYKNINNVLTISRSGTLINVFKYLFQKNKKLRITVLESRPAMEGRETAKSLVEAGIRVELITEAMSSIAIKKIDAVVIGADKILGNGNVVNKTGSFCLALLCREYKRPFLVLTTKSKYSKEKTLILRNENVSEIWNYKHKNLTLGNIYFEEIDRKLITDIITEN
jgi:translation initiation factor 2B subunit (eIF-2B alpha/beta/delta family)